MSGMPVKHTSVKAQARGTTPEKPRDQKQDESQDKSQDKSPAQAPPPAVSASSGPSGLRSALETVGLIVAPATLLSALMFYFGWVRTNEFVKFFGIDHSVLGFTAQDYILRSVDSIYRPLGLLLIVALLALWVHVAVSRRLAARPNAAGTGLRVLWLVLVVVGLGLLAVGVAGLAGVRFIAARFLVKNLSLAFAVVLLAYAVQLGGRLHTLHEGGPAHAALPRGVARVAMGLCVALVVLSLFSATEEYAGALGRGLAYSMAVTLESRSGVIVYSPRDLHIDAPGVTRTTLAGKDSAYRYRYAGLRLFIRTNNRYFLLPATWSAADSDVMIVLPDDGTLRFEFTPGFD